MMQIDSRLIAELSKINTEMTVSAFVNQFLNSYSDVSNTIERNDELGVRILTWLDHGFMVKPSDTEYKNLKEWNPRLYNQKGAFFVFANKSKYGISCASTIEARSEKSIILPELSDAPNIIYSPRRACRIIIPHEAKKDILNKLNSRDINESKVYP